MKNRERRQGFTIVELIVVTLIIGILATFAVPAYLKATESTRADDAIATVRNIADANRMYAVEHFGRYAEGSLTNTCNDGGDCGPLTDPASGCLLLRCRYLANKNWDSSPFAFAAANGKVAVGTCAGVTVPSRKYVACAKRRSGTSPGTNISPYRNWGYAIDVNSVLTSYSGAPIPSGL